MENEQVEMVEVEGYTVSRMQHDRLQRGGNGQLGLCFETANGSRGWVHIETLQLWESWGRGTDAKAQKVDL